MKKVVFFFIIFLTSAAIAQTAPQVKTDLKSFDENLAKLKLKHMVEIDQYMRNYWNISSDHQYSDSEKKEFEKEFLPLLNSIDSKNTAELKALLKKYHWFTISQFGKESDQNAWLLVQHADQDRDFQKKVLAILTELYPKGETNPSNYAYLHDRVSSSPNNPKLRKPQKYGTQGTCLGLGLWQPFPVEDPVHLDERRKEVGLEIEAKYIERFKTICR